MTVPSPSPVPPLAALEALARDALPLWDLPPEAPVTLLNLSENATWRVDLPDGERRVLRQHRPGYHSDAAIESELAWMRALQDQAGVITPQAIPGRDGALIQAGAAPGLDAPRAMVLFHFIEGREPMEDDDLIGPFEHLGTLSARLHAHARSWRRPAGFTRLTWDGPGMLDANGHWGDWRAAVGLDGPALALLERLSGTLRRRLEGFGRSPGRFGLIHADIRLANLLLVDDSPRILDFDDCGFGWFLYDVATTVSFFEHSPKVPDLIAAWLRGYRRVAPLSDEDEAQIPTFVLLRRMVLLAWSGSHAETELAQSLGPAYSLGACDMAEDYLARFG